MTAARLAAEEARTLSDFSLSVRNADGAVTVAVSGDVDLAAADGLWEDLSPLLTTKTTMLMDCSGVTFMDSAGLRTLLRLSESAGEVGATFRVTAASAEVQRVAQLAGVEYVLAGPDGDPTAA